jgi:hypothetical protein
MIQARLAVMIEAEVRETGVVRAVLAALPRAFLNTRRIGRTWTAQVRTLRVA